LNRKPGLEDLMNNGSDKGKDELRKPGEKEKTNLARKGQGIAAAKEKRSGYSKFELR